MARFRTLAAAVATLLTLPALASEGRIPIPFTNPVATPVLIATPGKYILTRNMAAGAGGPVIDIVTPGDVEIDLNGFTLDEAGGASSVIRISAAGPGSVVLRNGVLRNGVMGIEGTVGHRTILVDHVQIYDIGGAGIRFTDVENYRIRNSAIQNASIGMQIDGAVNQHGLIEQNLIRRCGDGIVLTNPKAVQVIHNTIQEMTGGPFTVGIGLDTGIGCLILENTVEEVGSAATPAAGIRLKRTTSTKLFDNVIARTSLHGIHLDVLSADDLLLKNVIRECGFTGGHGIFIEGDRNFVEGNLSNFNSGKGLVFVPGADNNVYRGNTARGNNTGAVACAGACGPLTDFCNAGAGNSSNGDNWLPVAPCL